MIFLRTRLSDVVKMARPGSTDTLSIDEGFVDLQTPVTDTEAPVKIGNSCVSKDIERPLRLRKKTFSEQG